MAKIKNMYECPRCEAPLLATKRPDKCPECKYDFGEAALHYKYPYTMSEQFEKTKDLPVYYDALLSIPIEKANSMMTDALHLIQTVPAQNVRVSDISHLVRMAIEIGKIATKYEEFLLAGGRHVPSLFMVEKKEIQHGDETRAGEKPPGGV